MATGRTYLFNKEILILNGAIISFLLLIVYFSPLRPSDEILFYTSDSLTYFNAGEDFFDFSKQGDSWTRPFLYSYFLKQVYFIGGACLIVILQSIFWMISANLVYYGIKNICEHIFPGVFAVTLFVFKFFSKKKDI